MLNNYDELKRYIEDLTLEEMMDRYKPCDEKGIIRISNVQTMEHYVLDNIWQKCEYWDRCKREKRCLKIVESSVMFESKE